MKISFTQVYLEEDANYPFSSYFQAWLAKQLSRRSRPSQHFLERYSEDFTLGFYISAKSGIRSPEIKGPGVYRKTNDVKYTIFLPFSRRANYKRSGYRKPLRSLFDGVIVVLTGLEIDTSRIAADADSLIEAITSDAKMTRDVDPQLLVKRKKAVAEGSKCKRNESPKSRRR